MQKIVSKYALAAHLAIMAVAPLLLLPFAGSRVAAVVMLWLSFFGFIWVLMEPSRRRREMPHDARARVGRAVLVDPLFWFSLVLVAYAGIRSANGGVGLSYDAERMVWSIREPFFPALPGCMDGIGLFPFSVVVSLAIVFQGTRHALGRSARGVFLVVGSLLSALSAIVFSFAISYGHAGVLSLVDCSPLSASYFGTAYGIMLLVGVAALFATVVNKWMKVEPLVVLGLVGNAVGLVSFSPPVTIVAFLAAFLLLVVVLFVTARGVFEGSGSFRCALAVLISMAAMVLYVISMTDVPCLAERVAAFKGLVPFQKDFFALRDALSSISLATWKSNPWLGTGLGSFPLDIRFAASASDWEIILPGQATALNGWWQLLVERGVIGAGMMAVAVGMLLWTYVSRFISSFSAVRLAPEHFLGPLAFGVMLALAFVDCSFLRPEVLLLIGTFLSFSGGAFPDDVKGEGAGKEN